MVVSQLFSADGLLALLDEKDPSLQFYALEQLNAQVNNFWMDISEHVAKIEILYENESFQHRELAALVLSKVYFHLGEYKDAVSFALGAGKYFSVDGPKSEFVDTIIGKCIDMFIELKQQKYADPSVSIDARMENVVVKMLDRCYEAKEFKQAIGIALESRQLDVIEFCISKGNTPELLKYTLNVTTSLLQHADFRNKVLVVLLELFLAAKEPDYLSVGRCLIWLNRPEHMSDILAKLIVSSDDILVAYQIAFDTYESATQEFLKRVILALNNASDSAEMETDDNVTPSTSIKSILSGNIPIKLFLEFLYRNNKSDPRIMKNTKNALDSRTSMFHAAVSICHAFTACGTTSDQFLRENMDWLSHASNWTKFTATAQLGVIHKGNISNSTNLLKPYLPQDGLTTSPYSEGGALYALGLIHANHGTSILDYMKKQLKNSQDEVVQHGACLGTGVAAMATEDEELFELLKGVLYGDNAVSGEAAGLAMGIVMLGSGAPQQVEEMLQYARDTKHEKIIRGLAVGLGLMVYGREEKADALIETLLSDKDPILRYGGVFAVSLAYAGTANNKAISKLLHLAVSDASEDVRRVAVIGLGYLLVKTPHQVPRLVQLLAESYNPHVRYGAALALGVSCAGTGMKDALELLDSLSKDNVDFVRQGAYMASAMILIQQNEASSPKVSHYRTLYANIVSEKHVESLAKFGAALSQGIIDAGGRNMTLSLLSRNGNLNMDSIVGMTLFLQHWYWYPLAHFLSLSFTPTALIALNKDLKIPKLTVISNAKPSLFAYPPMLNAPTEDKVEKVATAVLSTTAKAKARAKKAEKEKGDKMETDEAKPTEIETEKATKPEESKVEPTHEMLDNMSRVVPAQLQYISFAPDSRYIPVSKGPVVGGIVIIDDLRPNEPVELMDEVMPTVASVDEEKEPSPPEPFEFPED